MESTKKEKTDTSTGTSISPEVASKNVADTRKELRENELLNRGRHKLQQKSTFGERASATVMVVA